MKLLSWAMFRVDFGQSTMAHTAILAAGASFMWEFAGSIWVKAGKQALGFSRDGIHGGRSAGMKPTELATCGRRSHSGDNRPEKIGGRWRPARISTFRAIEESVAAFHLQDIVSAAMGNPHAKNASCIS